MNQELLNEAERMLDLIQSFDKRALRVFKVQSLARSLAEHDAKLLEAEADEQERLDKFQLYADPIMHIRNSAAIIRRENGLEVAG